MSDRLGDVLVWIYRVFFKGQESTDEDPVLIDWSVGNELHRTEEQLYFLLNNFPNRFITRLKLYAFPSGKKFLFPDARLGCMV